ncbi:MAG: hypothetical protein ACI4MR_05315, partial [Candidatus Aphodomorpha sp.]
PTATPAATEEPVITTPPSESGASATGSAFAGVVRLSYRPAALLGEQVEVRKYTDEQRQLFDDYCKALQKLEDAVTGANAQAKKYRSGSSNSLSGSNSALEDALSNVKELAMRLATEFGYKTSKLNWQCRYEYDRSFNEIRVNFN